MFGVNKKLKQKPSRTNEKKAKKSVKEEKVEKRSSLIPDLISKSYSDGCLILGCVHDIYHSELSVSLPGIGNYGYVKLNNISTIYSSLLKKDPAAHNKNAKHAEFSSLASMYSKGNLLRCKVLSFNNNKLNLTIEPGQINSNLSFNSLEENMIISGAVKSKEDHGYTIDLGISDLAGFFKTDTAQLSLGQTCLFKLISKKSERAISLKLCDQSESSFYEVKSRSQFDTYLPGAQLTGSVEKISRTGVELSLAGQITGFIHANHLPTLKREALAKRNNPEPPYTKGDSITGTLIFLNPYSKIIYLSLLPHLTNSTKPSKIARLFNDGEDSLKLGQVVSSQVSAHSFKGVYVKFAGANSKTVTGFIPKKHLFEKESKKGEVAETDEDDEDEDENNSKQNNKLKKFKKDVNNMKKEDLEKQFPVNKQIPSRIYDFSLLEDVILLSARESVINSPFISYDDLKVGEVVKGIVRGINPHNGGVNVKLSDFVAGFVPKSHTADVPLSETLLARKLKVGSEIKCRVVQIDAAEKRCVLTAKKTLVKSKLALITSFDELKVGAETFGTIVSIQKYGLIVSFLNEIKGLLPRSQISGALANDEDLAKLYYIGQLVKCRVFEFDRNAQTLKLSLIMDESEEKNDENGLSKFEEEYEIGDFIESATVIQVNEEKNYFRVKLPHGKRNGIIYKNQLSDFDFLNEVLFDCYKRSMRMKDLTIIQNAHDFFGANLDASSKKNQQLCHFLTMKQTLVNFYTNKSKPDIVKSFEELKCNDWLHGWVRKILPTGILVEIPHGLVGFASNQEISYLTQLKSSNLNGLSLGHSVLIKINKLFAEKKQFLTQVKTRHSLHPSHPTDTQFMLDLFKSLIVNTSLILNTFESLAEEKSILTLPGVKEQWKSASKIKIGSVVKVAVRKHLKASKQVECVFIDDANDNKFDSNLIGIAYVLDENEENVGEGAKMDALVLGFDALTKNFCLSIDKKSVKIYRKNFEARSQLICRPDQLVKSEVLYVSQWFCIVGLKAHALGRLALMPLFKNDFTQLDTFNAAASGESVKTDSVEAKIKKEQLLKVSAASVAGLESAEKKVSKEAREFNLYSVGQVGKVCVKLDDAELDYAIVVHDSTGEKRTRKILLRQLAVLNETHVGDESAKSNGQDEPVLVKKKLVLDKKGKGKRKSEENEEDKDYIEIVSDVKRAKKGEEKKEENGEAVGAADSVGFPWDVKDFDQFNKIVNSLSNGENGEEEAFEEEESQPEDSEEADKKKEKKGKKNFVNDKTLYQIEEKTFDPARQPETADDYERLLAASPNSSFLWIKYMAFYLQSGETEKAREVAKQALKTINYRDDSDRLNVWVALLNFENLYGTTESLEDIFNQATQNCDSLKVHSHLAEIFSRAGKLQDAETVYMKMTRKFGVKQDVWIKYAVFHYRNANCESARKLLIKSFNTLDKKEHIEMTNKFAQLEFKYGDVERGKTMYDSLLFTYPNRTDIWSVYIDLLVKHEKIEDARNVFNRIVQLGLSPKRMKFVFKKFLNFEKTHGNEELVDKVKTLAVEYVNNKQTKN